MNSKEYLNQIRKMTMKIKSMKLRSEEYGNISTSLKSPEYDKDKIQCQPSKEPMFVKWVHLKIDLEEKTKALEERLSQIKEQTMSFIERMSNDKYKELLIYRYFKFMSWNQIGRKLYGSSSTIFRWHTESLAEFDKFHEEWESMGVNGS